MSTKGKILSIAVGVIAVALIVVLFLPKCDICDKIGAFNSVYAVTTWKLCDECYDEFNDEDNSSDSESKESTDTPGWECTWCGGDGATHDWNDEGQTCWHCGGDGWVSPDEADD